MAAAQTQRCIVFLMGPLGVVDETGRSRGRVPAGRASLLLQRLAVASPGALDAAALIDVLWPDGAPQTAARTLASLASRLRSAVGSDVVVGTASDGYRFGVEPAWTTDVGSAERLASEAHQRLKRTPALAASAARRGLDLLERGRPLDGHAPTDQAWVEQFEWHVDGLRRRLRRALWQADGRLGRWEEIIDQAEAALEAEPHDEDAARALMAGHWHRGDRGSALYAHDRLRAHLRDELGVEPSSATEDLYDQIVRDARPELALDASEGGSTPIASDLVGRDRELATLLGRWEATVAGEGSAAVIAGPLGSGRSRLGNELAAAVERTGGRTLRAECYEADRSLFLQPILASLALAVLSEPPEQLPALFDPWLGTAGDLIPELHELTEIDPYQRASPDLEHRRALQTIAHVVGRLAERRPILWFFDDLHHAGSSSVEALCWLARELADAPVMLVATVQSDQVDPPLDELASLSTVVELGALGEHEVAAMARASGLADAAEFVWELTKGQLLFVTEVLAALQRGVPRNELSGSLSSVVLAGVRRSGSDVEEVLRSAAAVGPAFDAETVAELAGRPVDDLLRLLGSATAAGLIESRDDGFVFANQVIRDVLYDTTPGPVRRRQHKRLAELYADQPHVQAPHLSAAGLTAEAAAAWLEAARVARRAFAERDAVRLYSNALDAAGQADASDVAGAALIGRGTALEELGEYEAATEDHRRAEALGLSLGDRSLRAQAVERLAWTAYYARDVDVAIARAEDAVAMPGAHPSAWVLLGRTRHWAGEFHQAAAAYSRALEDLDGDETVRASALSCLGALLEHGDRYHHASEVLDEAVELSRRIGAFRPLLRALFFQGLARTNAGDLAGALTAFEAKKTLLHRYDVSFYRARTNTCLAWIWRELGDLGRARALSEQALEESRQVAEGELQVEQELHALCSIAECELMAGRPEEAAELLADAQPLLDGWLPFRWRAELRVVELGTRLAEEDPERLLDAARQRGSTKYEALALAHLGQDEAAGEVAASTKSPLLVAEVAPMGRARTALDRLALHLPRQLRQSFVNQGRLASRFDR